MVCLVAYFSNSATTAELDQAHTCQMATASKLLQVCELGTSILAVLCLDTAPVHQAPSPKCGLQSCRLLISTLHPITIVPLSSV